jgi:hypothetical protein
MVSATGGCLCGRVRYAIVGEPIRSGICHCRNCQRYTGSAFEPFMIFPTASVSLQGELCSFGMTSDSGNAVYRRFCPNCGSGVVNEGDRDPGRIVVLVGTLDDPTAFAPTVDIFCDTARSWAHATSGRKQFRGMPA